MNHHFIDQYCEENGILQKIPAMLKLIGFVLFVLCVVFTDPRSLLLIAAYLLFVAIAVAVSRVPFHYILKRVLVIVPFVVMVALFLPFLKSGNVIASFSAFGEKLNITREGLWMFFGVTVKSLLSTVSAIILASTTNFSELLLVMRRLKVPSLFVMILSFMYRYVFIIVDEFEQMMRAKKSRTCGGSNWFHLNATANMTGSLFIRSYERGESVYLAMCSRGFNVKGD